MAKHVQGSAVANATSYKLYENIGGNYTEKATQPSGGAIDFDLSTISFAAGTHQLAVKAFASGYLDSAYSNLVNYIVEATQPDEPEVPDVPETPTESVWYINMLDEVVADGKDLTKSTWMTTSTTYTPWAFSENINSKVQGKTINAVEVFAHTSGGTITYPQNFSVGVVNYNTGVYTKKATCVMPAGCENTCVTLTFPEYTIGEDEFFTFNHDGDKGCTGYFLQKDLTNTECTQYMYQGADAGTQKKFNHQLGILINVGYITSNSGGSGGSGGSGESGTSWYIKSLQELQETGNDIATNRVKLQSGGASYSWAFNQLNTKLEGKTVNTIEMMPAQGGSFSVGVFNPSTNTVSDKKTFTVDTSDVNTIKTYRFDDLTIPTGCYFVWNCSGTTTGEAIGYYVLKAKLDPLAVETSNWYQVKSSGLVAFGEHELVFVANIGYTA